MVVGGSALALGATSLYMKSRKNAAAAATAVRPEELQDTNDEEFHPVTVSESILEGNTKKDRLSQSKATKVHTGKSTLSSLQSSESLISSSSSSNSSVARRPVSAKKSLASSAATSSVATSSVATSVVSETSNNANTKDSEMKKLPGSVNMYYGETISDSDVSDNRTVAKGGARARKRKGIY